METGQIILTILLLIIVIALGFSYSEEVSSNRRLRAELKRYTQKPTGSWQKVNTEDGRKPIEHRFKVALENIGILMKETEALEHTIALKDEEIKNLRPSKLEAWAEAISVKELKAKLAERDETIKDLNGDIAKLKFDYAAEVAGRNEPLRGEWLYDGEPDTSGEPGIKSDGRCADPSCHLCYGEKNAHSPKAQKIKDQPKPVEVEVTCNTCDGSGTFENDKVCPGCDGEGSVKIDV